MPLISAPEFSEQTRAHTFEEQLLGGRSNASRAKIARPDRTRRLARHFFGLLLLVGEAMRDAVLLDTDVFSSPFVVLPAARVFDRVERPAPADPHAGAHGRHLEPLIVSPRRSGTELLKSPIERQSAGRSSGFG